MPVDPKVEEAALDLLDCLESFKPIDDAGDRLMLEDAKSKVLAALGVIVLFTE